MRNVKGMLGVLRRGGLVLLLVALAGAAQAQTTVEYIHTDALGSVVAVTNEAGQVVERFDYEPYGAIIGQPNYGGVGFTGHVQDAATGLTYMQQRYYDPGIATMLSVDPVTAYEKPLTNFCRYCYARNNPYRFTDPDGRDGMETFAQTVAWGDINYANANTLSAEDASTGLTATMDVAISVAADLLAGGPTGESAAIFTGLRAARIADKAGDTAKASKVAKSVQTEKIGKFTKITEVRPGKGPGQSRAEYVRVKNQDGKTIRTHKDSYDRAGNFQGRKPLTGGPEGRPLPPPPPKDPLR